MQGGFLFSLVFFSFLSLFGHGDRNISSHSAASFSYFGSGFFIPFDHFGIAFCLIVTHFYSFLSLGWLLLDIPPSPLIGFL
ncbi:hypothetical protein QBC40DRAFT_274366 [Triangularia verruculosa]|uniref:Secreted protein n=1 Tax=Triangularia verruculosa TaxID=2587418 RepID=A0AAN6XN83_9PEZI|nr:hypothetical protein QBC40DRAFT_274366 [Triangularia verruculosa]